MQWVIDLIIEAIGVPPCYIDRGDPAAYDWDKTTLTTDGAWHELDLSGIVGPTAKAVVFRLNLDAPAVEKVLALRRKGNVNTVAASLASTQVAGITRNGVAVVSLSEDLKIEYLASDVAWGILRLAVTGWIL